MRVMQQQLRESLGYFWSNLFNDQDFLTGLTRSIAFRAESSKNLEEELDDYMSRKTIPSFREWDSRLFFFDTADMRSAKLLYGEAAAYGAGLYSYGDVEENPENPTFPIGKFTPAYLTTDILNPTNVYEFGKDYVIQEEQIVFLKNPLTDTGVDLVRVYDETEDSLSRTFQFWGFKTLEDMQSLCDFYGTVAGVCSRSSETLKSAINLAWELRLNGSSDTLLKQLLSLVTDVDYVDTAGTVQDIYIEGDRLTVQLDTAVYTAPIGCAVNVLEGQSIVVGQELFDAYDIIFPNEVLPPNVPEGLALGRGYLAALQGSILIPNKRHPITNFRQEDWYEVIRVSPTEFNKYNRNGNIIEVIPEADAVAEILAAPEEQRRFPVYGFQGDIDLFFELLNAKQTVTESTVNSCGDVETTSVQKNFFDKLADTYGKIPDEINPLAEFRRCYLNDNAIFLHINKIGVPQEILAQLLNILHKTIAAGSTFFTLLDIPNAGDEVITSNTFAEDIEVFYIVDIDELAPANRSEALIAAMRI